MFGRSSIGRWMLAMALIGLALALARSWLDAENRPGELGPTTFLALVAVALAIVVQGRSRRFFLGFALVGLWVSVGFLWAPWDLRVQVNRNLVGSIEARCGIDIDRCGLVSLSQILRWQVYQSHGDSFWINTSPFSRIVDQGFLALLQMPIALVGGLLTASPWRKARRIEAVPVEGAWS